MNRYLFMPWSDATQSYLPFGFLLLCFLALHFTKAEKESRRLRRLIFAATGVREGITLGDSVGPSNIILRLLLWININCLASRVVAPEYSFIFNTYLLIVGAGLVLPLFRGGLTAREKRLALGGAALLGTLAIMPGQLATYLLITTFVATGAYTWQMGRLALAADGEQMEEKFSATTAYKQYRQADLNGAAAILCNVLTLRERAEQAAQTLTLLAEVRLEQGNTNDALALADAALEADPQASEPYVVRAVAHAVQGEFSKSVEAAKQGVTMDPIWALRYAILAWAEAGDGNLEQSRAHEAEAEEGELPISEVAPFNYYMAAAAYERGEQEGARLRLLQVLHSEPRGLLHNKAQAMLADIYRAVPGR